MLALLFDQAKSHSTCCNCLRQAVYGETCWYQAWL